MFDLAPSFSRLFVMLIRLISSISDPKEYQMDFFVKKQKGFTFIELVCVLLLLAVLGVVILTRTTDYDAEAIAGREQIKNHIRFSQLMAMKSSTVCGVKFNGSVYWIFKDGSTADKIALPHDSGETISIHSSLGSATETIYFDLWGCPYSDASLTIPRPSGDIGGLGLTMFTDTGYVE
jgi:prepilin-type N-terminal cleavage/methylation domain-containing protein